MEAKRSDLVRMLPAAEGAVRMSGDDGAEGGNTLVLEPIVFNRWTEINNPWEGHFLERIGPGAVKKTLAERGDKVKILFNHGMDPSIGNKPLGPIREVTVDADRVRMFVPLSDTSYNADLKALLRDKALDGASFRFDIVQVEENKNPEPSKDNPLGLPERTVTELRLYEAGPVTFPAYEAASSGVRSVEEYRKFKRADEEAAGSSRTSEEPSTEEPGLVHSTAARRSLMLRKVKEAIADERNSLVKTIGGN